jgi:hypothetical protein
VLTPRPPRAGVAGKRRLPNTLFAFPRLLFALDSRSAREARRADCFGEIFYNLQKLVLEKSPQFFYFFILDSWTKVMTCVFFFLRVKMMKVVIFLF